LDWLQNYLTGRTEAPALYLRYGDGDRFAAVHRMPAASLPNQNVLTAVGVDNWESCLLLWDKLLDVLPFGVEADAQ
jgi:hypothetical protein